MRLCQSQSPFTSQPHFLTSFGWIDYFDIWERFFRKKNLDQSWVFLRYFHTRNNLDWVAPAPMHSILFGKVISFIVARFRRFFLTPYGVDLYRMTILWSTSFSCPRIFCARDAGKLSAFQIRGQSVSATCRGTQNTDSSLIPSPLKSDESLNRILSSHNG